jgi:iron only hydrogenase large subunit-like protein
MSVAPQVLASLSATLACEGGGGGAGGDVGLHRVLARVRAFAKHVGFAFVFDTSFARHVAHKEHVREFEERSSAHAGGKRGQGLSLPMLASACPGWVCYAEKTHGQLLPFMGATKSPQQVMGTLVKRWLGRRVGKRYVLLVRCDRTEILMRTARYVRPDEIYHVAVMPCYDKKLEASRQDFYNEQYRTRDVDCVITTGELEILMQETGWDLHAQVEDEDRMETYLPPKADDSSSVSSAPTSLSSGTGTGTGTGTHVSDLELEIPELVQQPGSSSGSWLQTIIAHVQEREAVRGRQTAVRSKIIRTGDYEDVWVESFAPPTTTTATTTTTTTTTTTQAESEVVFRGAKCYGFRNLQNVVRKVGRGAGIHVGAGAAGRLADGESGGGGGGGGGSDGGSGVGRTTLRARRAKQQVGSVAAAPGAEQGAGSGTGSGRIVKGQDRPYDYVEVMACPAGCVNGGGQARRRGALFTLWLIHSRNL